MNERQRALEVLREAREILLQRLAELVVEQEAEILADARGDSYMNEIESLYEQVGMKLAHLGQMLSHIPDQQAGTHSATAAAQHDSRDTFTLSTDPAPSADAIIEDTIPALAGPVFVATPALPPPRSGGSRVRATQLSLQAFAAQIQSGNLLAAGRTIGALFELEEPRAIACAAVFAQRARSEAGFFRKALQLRSDVATKNDQHLFDHLFDCFGLSRGESRLVVETLRRRLRLEQ